MALNLDELTEPQFEVVFDGKTRVYDPWQTLDKLSSAMTALQSGAEKFEDVAESIRSVMGFPAGASGEKTPSVSACLAILTGLADFVKEIPALKKLQGLMPNSFTSTQA